jgi:hypothetical protein
MSNRANGHYRTKAKNSTFWDISFYRDGKWIEKDALERPFTVNDDFYSDIEEVLLLPEYTTDIESYPVITISNIKRKSPIAKALDRAVELAGLATYVTSMKDSIKKHPKHVCFLVRDEILFEKLKPDFIDKEYEFPYKPVPGMPDCEECNEAMIEYIRKEYF